MSILANPGQRPPGGMLNTVYRGWSRVRGDARDIHKKTTESCQAGCASQRCQRPAWYGDRDERTTQRHHPEEPEEGAEEGLTADSRAEVEAYRQQVRAEGREDEDEDEYYDEGAEETFSEGSSAVFDADNDPAGFAERLDELAGVLEVREDEARAVRWGPDLSGGGECWLEGG